MKRLLGIATLALMLAGTTLAQNLVTNGGFELGNAGGIGAGGFTGWSSNDPDFNSALSTNFLDDGTYAAAIGSPITPHSGSYMADFGSVGTDTNIYQTIGTTAGNSYQVSFWLANDDGCAARGCFTSINVSFGGVTLISDSLQHPYGWTHFTYTVKATGSASNLVFDIQQDPSYYYLDDVSVTQTPEPGSLALLGSAFGLGAGLIRRFRS